MQCCSLILWNCRDLYCIRHLLGWKEGPALLTAGYKTDSNQRMFNTAYNYCLPTLLLWSVWDWKRKTWIWSCGGGMLNWFHSANCYWSAGLKSLGDTLSAGRPSDLYLDLAVPKACHIPPRGSSYTLYRETEDWSIMGVLVLQHGSDTVEQQHNQVSVQKGIKRNAEWMADGGLEEALQSWLKTGMAVPQLKLNRGRRQETRCWRVAGIPNRETENSWATEKENYRPCTVCLPVLTEVTVEHLQKSCPRHCTLLSLCLLETVCHGCGYTQSCVLSSKCATVNVCVTKKTCCFLWGLSNHLRFAL